MTPPNSNAEFAASMEQVLDVAETGISVMSCQCLNRRTDFIDEMRREVDAWQTHRDRIHAKTDWQFTSKDAHRRLKRLYPTHEI